MIHITHIAAREILDSRGNPTVEVDMVVNSGAFGRASVPSGASTGSHEAFELRDGGKRYGGKGVLRAVKNVREVIASAVVGKEFQGQREFDEFLISLDGTPEKKVLGANAILACSLAFLKASAADHGVPVYQFITDEVCEPSGELSLPRPLVNVVNGGRHVGCGSGIQEYMIIPKGASTFAEAVRWSSEIFHALGPIVREDHLNVGYGDEGGYAPPALVPEVVLSMILRACEDAGYEPGRDVFIGLDVAANELRDETGEYVLETGGGTLRSARELVEYFETLSQEYPLLSIEDPFAEDDWDPARELVDRIGRRVMIVGDDVLTTDRDRLNKAAAHGAVNAVLVKPNQRGTVSETIGVMQESKALGFPAVVSHRSGETEDAIIADIAVGCGAEYIKTGSVCRGERTAKYNQLLRIEEEIQKSDRKREVDGR